ncbi:MAG TPA: type II secretion system F family protein [Chthoniobacterales bacterium]|nr:type II secretion system F family protein [Chthoniobacterales bacterium]
MARYEYITQKAKGAPYVATRIDAVSVAELNVRLINLNRPVIRIEAIEQSRTRDEAMRVPLRAKLTFIEQLETSAYLGMDFRTSLTICLNTTSVRTKAGRRLAKVIADLRDRVSRGSTFSRAIRSYPQIFDEVAVGLITAGEEGGTLSEALTNVRKIWARNDDLQHRLLMMLIYPVIVSLAACGVVWLLMTKVVPQFIHVLTEIHAELPLPTQVLLQVSQFSSQHPLLLLFGITAIAIGILRLPALVKRTPRSHRFVLCLPIFGKLLLLLIRANFSRTFAQLKTARAKTTQALLLCRDLSWNYEYRSAVARTLVRVHRGESLAAALRDDVEIFGDLVVNGLTFMEASGAGSEGLFRLTELLERQLDSYLGAIRQILDPLLIIILGVVIGGIVFATFLPAVQILQTI